MIKPGSYSISLTSKWQSSAVVLVRPLAVARSVPWQGLSIFPPCYLLGCFLGIGSLGFSEFWHCTRKPYQVVRARFFGKTFFCPQKRGKWAKNRPKVGFFGFKEIFGNFPRICFIMKIYIIKNLYLVFRYKFSVWEIFCF